MQGSSPPSMSGAGSGAGAGSGCGCGARGHTVNIHCPPTLSRISSRSSPATVERSAPFSVHSGAPRSARRAPGGTDVKPLHHSPSQNLGRARAASHTSAAVTARSPHPASSSSASPHPACLTGATLPQSHPAPAPTFGSMSDLPLKVFAKSMPAPKLEGAPGPQPHSGPPKPNLNMEGQQRPPAPHALGKQGGENAMQALQRHIDAHDDHLNKLESDYGLHVPRGTATIMKGLPGSGKSHYLKNHHLGHGTHMHVDVDALKHLATGEHDFKYPKEYPDSHPTHGGKPHPLAGQRITEKYDESDPVHVVAAHPVSKRLEEHMFHECARRRIPMALDTTGGNHKKWGERIDHLRSQGYHHVGLVDVRVSKETSQARNAGRKRTVPQSIIDETYAEHDRSHPANAGKTPFEHLKKKVDQVKVVDHESPQGQATRAANGWHSFLSGAGGKPMAKADAAPADDAGENPFRTMLASLFRSR